MISIALFCLAMFIVIPSLVAIAEAQQPKITTDDEGYWTLARALLGGCHLKWTPEPLPIVWFDVGLSQGRLHMFQRAGDASWWFEARIYLSLPLGFAARLAHPAAPPLQPTFPEMREIEDTEEDSELKLSGFSIETNAAPRLLQCLSTDEVRPLLKALKGALKVSHIEFIFAHRVFVVRGSLMSDERPSELAERLGPQLANWIRLMIIPLNQSSDRLISRHDQALCPASAVDLRLADLHGETWTCPQCSLQMYRAASEVMKGCVNPHCDETVDGIAEEVILSGRPQVEVKEVDVDDVGDHGWISETTINRKAKRDAS